MRRYGISLAALLWCGWAEAQPPSAPASARSHFEAGIAAAGRGEMETALREFEAAYTIQPRPAVLYNIGQAQTVLGRPVEAIATFEKYLAQGGAQLPAARREEIAALIAQNRKRTGQLRLDVEAHELAQVWLDGKALANLQSSQTLTVPLGEHTILHSRGDGFPATVTVAVAANATAEVRIPNQAPRPVPAANGWLAVRCPIPGVQVSIHGKAVGKTPIAAPLSTPSGKLAMSFSRPGYQSVVRTLTIPANGFVEVDCALRQSRSLSSDSRARLTVITAPKDADVFVDGERYLGAALPEGPHQLRVERDGFVPQSTTLMLTGGAHARHVTILKPTSSNIERRRREAGTKRAVGYALAGSSAAVIIGGALLYRWNQRRYDAWLASRTPESPLVDRAVSIQRVDDASVGLLAVGLCLGAGAGWAFWSAGGD
jgi:PEGA domain